MWVLFIVLVSLEEPLTKGFNSELECRVALEQVENHIKNNKDVEDVEDVYCEEIKLDTKEISM